MGKDDKKRIRNSTAEFLVFTAQAGDAGAVGVCDQEVS